MDIIIPEYFEYSHHLYFTNYFDAITTRELSSLYNNDREAFHIVLLEMKMRGFLFESKKKLLPIFTCHSTPKSLIISEENGGKNYEKINFEQLGLGSFIYTFAVEDDLFFNKMPIEGFLEFNPSIDINLLSKSFMSAGFKIVPIEGDINCLDFKNENLENKTTPNSLKVDKESKNIKEDHNETYNLDIKNATVQKRLRNKYKLNTNVIFNIDRKHSINEEGSVLSVEDQINFLNCINTIENKEYKISNFNIDNITSLEYLLLERFEYSVIFENYVLEFYKKIWNTILSDKDQDILDKRINQKLTLEETAKFYDVTRERIRQIVNKLTIKLSKSLYEKKILQVFENEVLNKRKYYRVNDFRKKLTDAQTEVFLNILYANNSDLGYQKNWGIITNAYYLQEEFIYKKYFNRQNIFSNEYLNFVKTEMENHSKVKLRFLEMDKFLKRNGFRQFNHIWVYKGISDVDIYGYIIKEYFEGTYHAEYDIEKMQDIYGSIYKSKELKARNVYARLQDNPDYILTDSHLFKNFKLLWNEEDLNKQIKFVENNAKKEISKNDKIDFSEDYKIHQSEYLKLNLESGLHAYSLLKRFRNDLYNFAPGNLLIVYPKTGLHLTRTEELEKYIRENGPVLAKKDIQDNLKWKRYTIDQTINESKLLFGWGEGYVRYLDQEILDQNEAELDLLITYLETWFEEDIAYPTEYIYYESLFDGFSELFHRLDIGDSGQFSSFLASVYSDKFITKGNFLVLNGKVDDFVIEEFVMNYLPNFFTRDKFKEVMKENLNYAETTISQYFSSDNYRNNIIYQLDSDLYCTRDKFSISKEDQKLIMNWLNNHKKDNCYFVLNNIYIDTSNLPILNFEHKINYNNQLLATILELNGFKLLTPNTIEVYPVLVYSDHPSWESFEDLIYDKIKFEKIYHLEELIEYLNNFFSNDPNININSLLKSFSGNKIRVDFETYNVDMERIL